VTDYQRVRVNLITMLEDLEEKLDNVLREEQGFENRVDKHSIEIEKVLLSDKRFNRETKNKR